MQPRVSRRSFGEALAGIRPPRADANIGHRLEKFQTEVAPFWTSTTETSSNGSLDAMEKAIAYECWSALTTGRLAMAVARFVRNRLQIPCGCGTRSDRKTRGDDDKILSRPNGAALVSK
jgi:hypothetical protein